MMKNNFKSPVKQLKEYLGEYQLLSNIYKPDLSFNSTFELNRRIKTLDRKTLLLVRKIDPLYESIITNNFHNTDSNKLPAILHRISLLECIVTDIDQSIIHIQI